MYEHRYVSFVNRDLVIIALIPHYIMQQVHINKSENDLKPVIITPSFTVEVDCISTEMQRHQEEICLAY